ncbi:hypothetical protein FGO68_gene11922 [Halteria grandinella]|uniref:UBX domain-containing protein 11 n=1 Tax=Halteria grandinella TaxID=5974 RepID=A0A8J8NSC7_HALGN|nr:hypothetical protein FGO68_gene11922 [Halteria grandinella]
MGLGAPSPTGAQKVQLPRQQPSSILGAGQINSGRGQDNDLLQSMMNRIAHLEQANAELRVQVKSKSTKLETLETESFILKSDVKPENVKKLKELAEQKAELQRLVVEMSEFLADYGLTWVGEEDVENQGAFNINQLEKEMQFNGPSYRNKLPAEIDTEVLTRRIEELNFIAEKQRIVKNKDGQHLFQKLNEVKINFYKNGLMIDGGFPFYPYHAKEAQSMLSDILDGYFPYDLKTKFPEGVPLRPVDLTDEMYLMPTKPGEKVGAGKASPRESILSNPKTTAQQLTAIGGSASQSSLLEKKSKRQKKEIDLEPIREELEEKFRETQGYLDLSKLNSNEPIEVDTHITKDLQILEPSSIVTMRVRTETGKRTLIVKLLITDKIEALYQAIIPYLENRENRHRIVVRTNFPSKAYQRGEQKNLKELGLAPSCALVIQVPI